VRAEAGVTLQEFIDELVEIAKEEGRNIEVVAHGEDGEPYTPVIGVGRDKDGIRRVSVA